MRRADRLFDIIQMLRVAVQPMTAAMIAERLEVTVRTVYRDIATLQARRGAWCELRNDFRHFRVERIIMATILNDLVPVDGRRLTERWFALQRERASDV